LELKDKRICTDGCSDMLYSNDAVIKLGPLDLVFEWNVISSQNQRADCYGKTVMSIAQAKRLQYHLAESLKIYEMYYGVILVPKDIWPPVPIEPQNAAPADLERRIFEWRKKKYEEFAKEQQTR